MSPYHIQIGQIIYNRDPKHPRYMQQAKVIELEWTGSWLTYFRIQSDNGKIKLKSLKLPSSDLHLFEASP